MPDGKTRHFAGLAFSTQRLNSLEAVNKRWQTCAHSKPVGSLVLCGERSSVLDYGGPVPPFLSSKSLLQAVALLTACVGGRNRRDPVGVMLANFWPLISVGAVGQSCRPPPPNTSIHGLPLDSSFVIAVVKVDFAVAAAKVVHQPGGGRREAAGASQTSVELGGRFPNARAPANPLPGRSTCRPDCWCSRCQRCR